MRPFPRLVVAILVPLALASGCSREEPGDAAPSAATDELSPAARERLEALGYEPWVEEEAPPQDLGVVEHDPARTADGYVLFANRGACSAVLMDRSGRVLHTWSAPLPASGYWSDTRLLPDGTLLVVGAHSYSSAKQQKDRFLRRLGWDSSVLWEADFPGHHDVEVTADATILTLSSEVRAIEYAGVATKIIDDLIVVAGDDGKTLQSYSLFDAFTATPGVALRRIDRRMVNVGGTQAVDLFHTNSVDRVALPALAGTHPLYAEGNILFSSRHQDTIAVLDPKQRKLVWWWGPGILEGQHSARWLANGNILVFDNGMVRRHSRVLEVDPRTNTIVWEYPGTKDDRFFTAGGGASQRLPNGNTLVTVTSQGMLFEVTAEGDVVWRFVNPNVDPQKRRRATIHASTWMSPEFVLPILARQR
jgi:hypothetical protein